MSSERAASPPAAGPDPALNGQTVFITGGAGFIGATVAGHLLAENEVVLFDNLERNSLQQRPFRNHRNLRLIEGDMLDLAALTRTIEDVNPTHIVHCAAIAGIDTVIQSPVRTLEVNMVGTASLLRAACVLRRLQRIVCFSSSEVFGQTAFQSDEDGAAMIGKVGVARWSYAVSKLSGEHLAIAYHKERGLPTTVLRPFNVYGPGQVGEGALSRFIQRALAESDLEIHGDGTQIRAWCYIEDMVRGVLLALEHPQAIGETFNIGNQRAVITIYGLANTVIRVLGSPSKVRFVHRDYADVELRVPSVRKARDLLGFEARVDLEEGIALTAASYSG
ncbi:MAG: NAD-dependent epimerase/dehydratase family protein [Gemmatimonadales bacterium]